MRGDSEHAFIVCAGPEICAEGHDPARDNCLLCTAAYWTWAFRGLNQNELSKPLDLT